MLTSQTIEKLEQESDRLNVQAALMTLAASNVLPMQIDSMQRHIMTNFSSADAEALAKEILAIREQTKALLGIHNLGVQLLREKGISR